MYLYETLSRIFVDKYRQRDEGDISAVIRATLCRSYL